MSKVFYMFIIILNYDNCYGVSSSRDLFCTFNMETSNITQQQKYSSVVRSQMALTHFYQFQNRGVQIFSCGMTAQDKVKRLSETIFPSIIGPSSITSLYGTVLQIVHNTTYLVHIQYCFFIWNNVLNITLMSIP